MDKQSNDVKTTIITTALYDEPAQESVQLADGIQINYDRESRTLLAFVPQGVMTIVIAKEKNSKKSSGRPR